MKEVSIISTVKPREGTMSIQNLFSTIKWNKVAFRFQLARIMQVFFILVFLTSAVGVNPAAAQDTLNVQLANPSASDNFSVQNDPALAPNYDDPSNEIVVENSLPGNPPSEWDVSGAGDDNIQGFATDISVNQGNTVYFKVDTDSGDYHLDIYRLGYYAGNGARKIDTIQPSVSLPQIQPACLFDTTGNINLIDCGNWAVSASWGIPIDAVSGIYIAKLVREDGTAGGKSHHVHRS